MAIVYFKPPFPADIKLGIGKVTPGGVYPPAGYEYTEVDDSAFTLGIDDRLYQIQSDLTLSAKGDAQDIIDTDNANKKRGISEDVYSLIESKMLAAMGYHKGLSSARVQGFLRKVEQANAGAGPMLQARAQATGQTVQEVRQEFLAKDAIYKAATDEIQIIHDELSVQISGMSVDDAESFDYDGEVESKVSAFMARVAAGEFS